MKSPPALDVRRRPRFGVTLVVIALATLLSLAGSARIATADTAPLISSVSPNTVSSDASDVTLEIVGDGLAPNPVAYWRGTPYAPTVLDPGTRISVTIPGSALAIDDAFETVDVVVVVGDPGCDSLPCTVSSNPRPVTIVGPAVTGAQSATAGAGQTVSVSTARLSASYTRAAAGYGTVTAVDYAYPTDPIYPVDPVSPVAFVDLQLRSAGVGDSLVGTFVPPNPVVPPNPIVPTPPPIVPPNPVRLAYWTGSAWAPVLGSGGAVPAFGFDYATTTASPASVIFDTTSSPQITALGGTVFAFVAAHAFAGFADPVDAAALNVARAGRVVPLKWRVLDLGGNPVLDLSGGAVTSVRVDCGSLSGAEDQLESYAPGASGLQNLGDGYYQWNWASERAWKGTCRRVRLDLGDRHPDGSPVYRTADFAFRS